MQLIPLSQRFIAGKSERTVSARKLHQLLGVARDFTNWIKHRIEKYHFQENQDFILVRQNGRTKRGRGGDTRSVDYWLTLEMAKSLAMVENNEKGDQARRYFIDCERKLQEQQRERLIREHQQQQALPAPDSPAPPSRALRSAINRQAHKVSLRAYESAKAQIEAWVRRWTEQGETEQNLIARIDGLTHPTGDQQIVSADTLWSVTNRIAIAKIFYEAVFEDIHKLEQATGREWYVR